jgi:hypothetical protein
MEIKKKNRNLKLHLPSTYTQVPLLKNITIAFKLFSLVPTETV